MMKTLAPWICPASAPVKALESLFADKPSPRSPQSVSRMNIVPAFEACEKLAPSSPAKVAASATPSCLRTIW